MNRARPELNSETTTTQAAPADQERLARILDEYLVAIEQGQRVSPDELLAKHPEDAVELRGYLSGLNLFHVVAVAPGQALGSGDALSAGVPPALQTIGDYRLVREIGRGGMGVVYEAWQVSLRRRVALKVLPFTSAHDAKHIGRFKNEAQAAAQVQHPNIVPVFAIGEENGVHFYVMQLIEGQSLTSLLGALRTGGDASCGSTAPNNGLTYNSQRAGSHYESTAPHNNDTSLPMRASETADHIRVVARLGIQAAEALHAAHEYGIVHRDVKPSNLLLDDQGKLWVTDFGLARCREDQGLTQTGDVLGTMRYMSPEQALGRAALVDQRTDVYSLGVTMYELATLNHPADQLSNAQLYFDRNRSSTKPLQHWNRHIPHDFQTIVLKCMAEMPHERYGSAKELADDLERFLDGRPILASPPSWWTRAGKWAKRRRGVVYAAAAVLLVALVGTVVSATMLSHERFAANERALHQARGHLRQLNDVLSLFTTQYTDELAAIPGAEGVRQEMLQDGLEFYQRFEKQAVDDPTLASDSALAESKLGSLNERLGNRTDALTAHTKAKDAWEELLARDPDNREYARDLALCLNNLGLLVAGDGRPAEAMNLLTRACDLQKNLAAGDPSSTDLETNLATTHGNLGLVLSQMQVADAAAAEYRAAIEIQQRLAKSKPADEVVLHGLAASFNNLASLQDAANPRAAVDAYQKAIEIQLELVKAFPINRDYQGDLARTYNNLGFLASRNKDFQRAEVCYADAIELQQNMVKASPLAGAYRRDLAISYNNLGMVQSRDNRFAEAEASFRQATRLQDVLLAAQSADVQTLSNQGSVWNNLGMLLDRQHRLTEAAAAYQKAIHFQSLAVDGAKSNDSFRGILSRHYFNYARNLAAQAKFDEAMQVALERGKLWAGQPDRLFSVAQELAGLRRQMTGRPGLEKTKAACLPAAIGTLREALKAGLSPDRLNDSSLSELSESAEFRQLLENPKVGLGPPASTRQAELSRVN
jgi:eukaryotic-like serine/threonine-protein kinase